MTREELIGYCRYYKGEEKCPYEHDNPDEKNIYTSKDVSIHTKDIAVYIEEMSAKWCPYSPNKIFNY